MVCGEDEDVGGMKVESRQPWPARTVYITSAALSRSTQCKSSGVFPTTFATGSKTRKNAPNDPPVPVQVHTTTETYLHVANGVDQPISALFNLPISG